MTKRANSEPGKRLRAARLAAGFDSAKKAAAALKMHYQNWIDHESGRRGISEENARAYAKKLKVHWAWLLTGHDPEAKPKIRLMGYIGAGAEVFKFATDELGEIETPPGAQEGDLAFIIRGVSMTPFHENGVIVARPVTTIDEVLYKLAVVELDDGRHLFKQVMPSSTPGRFTLLSLGEGASPIADVRIISAAKFRVYVEPE